MFDNEIRLSCGDWKATILPSNGANAIRLEHKGYSILRSASCPSEIEQQPYLFGMPILFPTNRTEDGVFYFEGKKYTLPVNEPEKRNHLHGNIWNAPFEVERADENSVTCALHNDKEFYPFPFSLFITYQLTEAAFIQNTKILNTGASSMPVLVAFHSTFNTAQTFRVPIGKRWERNERLLTTGRMIDLNEPEKQIAVGTASCKQKIAAYYTSTGCKVRIGEYYYEVSPNFTQWVIYSADGNQGYICVEPQSGPVNGLNREGGSLILKTYESAQFVTKIYPT